MEHASLTRAPVARRARRNYVILCVVATAAMGTLLAFLTMIVYSD